MDTKVKNIPKTPMALYIKFYCQNYYKKNGLKRTNIVEATKSWLALSEDEKLMFGQKLKQYKKDYKHNFAQYLISVVPYMKKKRQQQTSSQIQSEPNRERSPENNTQENDFITCEQPSPWGKPDNEACDDSRTTSLTQQPKCDDGVPESSQSSQHFTDIPQLEPEVPEPVTPNVKTAEELFQIVNSRESRERLWNTLSKPEKKHYQLSLRALKRNYIQKYKAYLESLPSQELYEYYIRKLHRY